MKKRIIWRLANRPTPSEVIELNTSGLLTKEEAREILLTEETEEKVSEDSLKSEIKFLRELVEKLSKGSQQTVVETIRYIDRPYRQYGWYAPYSTWCGGITLYGTSSDAGLNNTVTNSASTLTALGTTGTLTGTGGTGFSSISTF